MPLSSTDIPAQSREVFWRRHILAQRSSPLGVAEYCRRHALNSPSFFQWRKRLGLKASAVVVPAFVAVEMPAAGGDTPLSLHIPGGRRLDIASHCEAALLRRVLEVLGDRPC